MNRFFIVLIFAFSLSSLLGIQATEGKWIAPSDANHPNTWMTFRKDIILPKRPEKAVAQIAVDSKYWLWINGQLAVFEGGVKRGPTPKDTYYDEVDLAPFLQKGKNQMKRGFAGFILLMGVRMHLILIFVYRNRTFVLMLVRI